MFCSGLTSLINFWNKLRTLKSVDAIFIWITYSPEISVKVQYWIIDMTFCFVQFFKHQVSNKKTTHQKESVNTYKSIVYGLKFISIIYLKKKINK